ncbi:MAG: prephenate dehydratase [Eggerthellaceae bacterium]|jgi:prephenate dehydratase|nr:prephenate dehydratase [Eggerthellaceae bacterium]MCH4220319.1 prephenate dehydratase [Eggerthellaceae bacterium]
MKQCSICYLGPEGTYSHEAAQRFAHRMMAQSPSSPAPLLVPKTTIADVFESIDSGAYTWGTVPIENSLEGPVTSTLDDFAFTSNAKIYGEEIIGIRHCLITQPGVSIDAIDTIVSHPQALGQCRHFIDSTMNGCAVETTTSTAAGVQRTLHDPHCAAIASAFAAHHYQASIVQKHIEDHVGNETSFVLIGKPEAQSPFNEADDRTSLALFLRNDHPGALLMILAEFAYAGINLTKIQSRPTKKALGDYLFFVDLAGTIENERVKTALDCLRLKLRDVKVLGSYPTFGRMRIQEDAPTTPTE